MRKDPLRHIYYKILSFLLYIKTKSRALNSQNTLKKYCEV